MRWFDTPPCSGLEVREASAERLLLAGPTPGQRVAGGATAVFGGVFASVGLQFLRLPIPAPFKLIPLAFTAVGSGLAALGVGSALASCSVEASAEGLRFRWKLPLRDERHVFVPAAEVAALEVTTHQQSTSSSFDDREHVVTEHRLNVITRQGQALPFEAFVTHAQAELRRAAIERLLSPRRG